jgi:hypothetical protein
VFQNDAGDFESALLLYSVFVAIASLQRRCQKRI